MTCYLSYSYVHACKLPDKIVSFILSSTYSVFNYNI